MTKAALVLNLAGKPEISLLYQMGVLTAINQAETSRYSRQNLFLNIGHKRSAGLLLMENSIMLNVD